MSVRRGWFRHNRNAARKALEVAPTDVNLQHVDSRDGGRVAVTLLPGGEPAVILCHGRVYDRESFLPFGEELQAAGYTVAVLDFRGYGTSLAGSAGDDAKELDVLATAEFLQRSGHSRVVPLGASMGGGAVLRAVAARRDLFTAMVTLSTVAVDLDLAAAWGNLPKLFVVSRDEPMHDQTAAMFEAAAEPRRLFELPGSLHAQQILQGPDAASLQQAVTDFLASL